MYGIDGVSLLVKLFARLDHAMPAQWAPLDLDSPWKSPGGILSPVCVGLAAGDTWHDSDDYLVETGAVAFPALVAGFLGQRLADSDALLCISCLLYTSPSPRDA